jgi:hypothetical protein
MWIKYNPGIKPFSRLFDTCAAVTCTNKHSFENPMHKAAGQLYNKLSWHFQN